MPKPSAHLGELHKAVVRAHSEWDREGRWLPEDSPRRTAMHQAIRDRTTDVMDFAKMLGDDNAYVVLAGTLYKLKPLRGRLAYGLDRVEPEPETSKPNPGDVSPLFRFIQPRGVCPRLEIARFANAEVIATPGGVCDLKPQRWRIDVTPGGGAKRIDLA